MTPQQLHTRFNLLATQWKSETGHISNISKKIRHPAYQEIVAMGMPVVREMLLDLKLGPADWFSALTTITGENPITEDIAGRIQEMSAAWVKLGEQKGWI